MIWLAVAIYGIVALSSGVYIALARQERKLLNDARSRLKVDLETYTVVHGRMRQTLAELETALEDD